MARFGSGAEGAPVSAALAALIFYLGRSSPLAFGILRLSFALCSPHSVILSLVFILSLTLTFRAAILLRWPLPKELFTALGPLADLLNLFESHSLGFTPLQHRCCT